MIGRSERCCLDQSAKPFKRLARPRPGIPGMTEAGIGFVALRPLQNGLILVHEAAEGDMMLQMLAIWAQIIAIGPGLDYMIMLQGMHCLFRPVLAAEFDVGVDRRDVLGPGGRRAMPMFSADSLCHATA